MRVGPLEVGGKGRATRGTERGSERGSEREISFNNRTSAHVKVQVQVQCFYV